MRKSLAPSQLSKKASNADDDKGITRKSSTVTQDSEKGMITIRRLPLFDFLEIPAALAETQYKVPSGCIITKKNIELRKVKTLGPQKNFELVRPGQFRCAIINASLNAQNNENVEDDLEEQLPNLSLPPFEPLVLWSGQDARDPTVAHKIEVVHNLASKLRPHQREGVQFLFECTMGLRGFEGQGCILADDMGLGKTLMSITIMWTLLNQGFSKSESAVRKVVIVCPTSLVGNWDNEIRRWVGESCPTFAVKSEPKKMIKNFVMHRAKAVLIVSYETQRLYSKLFAPSSSYGTPSCCDLLICDEAHKLKNAESDLAKSLNLLPARKRILLSGTPMQNELREFYNMVNFCNPNILGSVLAFKKRYERPILAAREPDASDAEVRAAGILQKELSTIVNEFILKRGNILNAKHLPPKLVQFVCCRPTPLQLRMYERLLSSKETRHIREGKQLNTLNSIRQLINLCSHPSILMDCYRQKIAAKEPVDDDLAAIAEMFPTSGNASNHHNTSTSNKTVSALRNPKSFPSGGSSFGGGGHVDPEQSGKMLVLHRMMCTMRALKNGERIVIVSNYTMTLDLIERLCAQNCWPVLRLDGTISGNKRTKLVDEFNSPTSGAFAFLLSSKAGGCGINLIGGSRLVLFDPDWNPASDKQAAARIWREGQKRRCFIYRFMTTGTIEEKIIQRQLSKEGLSDIVDNKEQVNQFSTDELKQLFSLRQDTRSDTHDTLRCKRCNSVKVLDFNTDKKKITDAQVDACMSFLDDFSNNLSSISAQHREKEAQKNGGTTASTSTSGIKLPFEEDITLLRTQLLKKEIQSLPIYSRKQRETFLAIDTYHSNAKKEYIAYTQKKMLTGNESLEAIDADIEDYATLFPSHYSLFSDFLKSWTDMVSKLSSLASDSKNNARQNVGDGDGEGDDSNSEFVDQEGCPEETDFNKWSHHCSVDTCDDDILMKSMGDDSTVSFVFGLEINWDLLQLREEETKEENELRKQQNKKDLEELNERRRKQRRTDAGEEIDEDGEEEEEEGGTGEGVQEVGDDEGISPVEQPILVKESRSSKRKTAGTAKSGKESAGKVIGEEGEKAPKKGKADRKTKKPAESELDVSKAKKSHSKSGRIIADVIDLFDDDGDEGGGGGAVDMSRGRHGDKAKAVHATPTVMVDCIDDDDYIYDDKWAEQQSVVADMSRDGEDEPQRHAEPADNAKVPLISSVGIDNSDLKKQRSKRRIVDDDDEDASVQSSSALLDITNKVTSSGSHKSPSSLSKKKKSHIEEEEMIWSCSHCTFNNEFTNEKRPKCTICGYAKGKK